MTQNLRWVSCGRYDTADVIFRQRRHLVPRIVAADAGALTTLCGATGMPASIWSPNSRKPKCPGCIAVLGAQAATERPARREGFNEVWVGDDWVLMCEQCGNTEQYCDPSKHDKDK